MQFHVSFYTCNVSMASLFFCAFCSALTDPSFNAQPPLSLHLVKLRVPFKPHKAELVHRNPLPGPSTMFCKYLYIMALIWFPVYIPH